MIKPTNLNEIHVKRHALLCIFVILICNNYKTCLYFKWTSTANAKIHKRGKNKKMVHCISFSGAIVIEYEHFNVGRATCPQPFSFLSANYITARPINVMYK